MALVLAFMAEDVTVAVAVAVGGVDDSGDDDDDDEGEAVIGTGLKLLLLLLLFKVVVVRCNADNLLSNDVNEVGLMFVLLSLKYFSDSKSPWRLRREI